MSETNPRATRRVSASGFVVAAIGFLLTRSTVVLAVNGDAMEFILVGILPLVLGLSLSAFGVALAVGSLEREFVRTVALWCVFGTAAMLALVILTILGTHGRVPTPGMMGSEVPMANFLIGGSVGGTLTGVYAGLQNRQQRAVREQTNRLVMLNRILRDEVINAVLAIRGYMELARDDNETGRERFRSVVDEKTGDIENTIDDVGYLTQTSQRAGENLAMVSVADCVENAVVYSDSDRPRVEVSARWTDERVRVTVADDGPGPAGGLDHSRVPQRRLRPRLRGAARGGPRPVRRRAGRSGHRGDRSRAVPLAGRRRDRHAVVAEPARDAHTAPAAHGRVPRRPPPLGVDAGRRVPRRSDFLGMTMD